MKRARPLQTVWGWTLSVPLSSDAWGCAAVLSLRRASGGTVVGVTADWRGRAATCLSVMLRAERFENQTVSMYDTV